MAHHHHVYSASGGKFLASGFRRLFLNPEIFLTPYVKPGMTVLDVGCGPGFFSIAAAKLVGPEGKVIAADLQQAMLDQLQANLKDPELRRRLVLYRCREDRIGATGPADVVLAINVVHELPDSARFFAEMKSVVRQGGTLLLREPAFISAREFAEELGNAARAGFSVIGQKRTIMSRVAALYKK